ncbi:MULTISPECIES: HMA2 domain-containing protein [Fischerella]|uniref:Uncharacterized protein n=1 Tax=Fischerella muscicola CCMEE 5323 TaxID=2019572 RepID=A0A2N6JYX2_FISMU|nr:MULTISPECIES: hypothetical protein [Fischerella]MBD2433591.1 hypothetical protein [Fischerella sp. FACHB-380]PLZ86289.1 hypothetical protein CEN44_20275 [Fischerella muscicola CCMEE 5323]
MASTVSIGEDTDAKLKTPPNLISECKQSEDHSQSKKTTISELAGWKSVSYWKEQGINFIAILASLLVTRMLGIKGWAAILFYLITVDPTLKVTEPRESTKQENLSKGKTNSVGSQKIVYSIVHAIPGRVRFNVPRIAQDLKYAQWLEKLFATDAYVTNVRVNRDAASIVINYKTNVMSDSQIYEHLATLIESTGDALVETLTVTLIFPACSLEVRQTSISSQSCCLLKSKSGKVLKGGALVARNNKLHRIGVLI